MEAVIVIIGVFIIVKLFKLLLDSYSGTIEQSVKFKKRIHQPFFNYSNGRTITCSLNAYYYHILSIKKDSEINRHIIFKHYQRAAAQVETSKLIGLKTKHNSKDLFAAYEYMNELCRYCENLN